MRIGDLLQWTRAAALTAVAALAPGPAPGGMALPLIASAAGTLVPTSEALARRGFSGGYFRPSASGFSFGGRRTPSFSGGYTRPRTPGFGGSSGRGFGFGTSAGDRALSRSSAGAALGRYRSQREAGTSGTSTGWGGGFSGVRTPRPWNSSDWYRRRGWSLPPYAYRSPPRFGVWNALFLWFLLDHLSAPGHAAFFYNHQDDPGYRQWRADAERQAQDNPALKAKLDQLDSDLAARQGQPRDPNYLPPGVPAGVAHAGSGPSAGGALLWLLLLVGGTAFLYGVGGRSRSGALAQSHRSTWASHKGAATVNPLQTIGNLLRRKASDQRYTPSLFRVGMTLTVDPAPFLLAAGVTKVSAPANAGQLTSVEALGTLGAGSAVLTRLYLPGSTSMFQIHLDRAGNPDECRYFGLIDEVIPADAAEWGAWLDPAEGMIGWPEFQTKDGKLYGRAWAPGAARIPPLHASTETIETAVDRTRTASIQAMLYGAATGLPPPAPATEYILVAAVEEGAAGLGADLRRHRHQPRFPFPVLTKTARAMTNTATAFLQTLGSGLWVLVPQFAVTLVLLAIGVAVYLWITPFDERGMVQRGNLAGGVTLGGTVLALSIPLATTLATSHSIIDILPYGGWSPSSSSWWHSRWPPCSCTACAAISRPATSPPPSP